MIIRPCKAEDLNDVIALENISFVNPWTEDNYRQCLASNNYLLMVAMEDELLVGYYCLIILFDDLEIAKVAISPPLRKRGLGYLLLLDIIKRAVTGGYQQIFLEVRVSNIAALNLYKKSGFIPVGTRKQYYQDGEDAAVLVWRHHENLSN